MSPHLVIAIVIFVLGCAQTVLWKRGLGLPALFLMVLEVEALKARDRARQRERAAARRCCWMCEDTVAICHAREDELADGLGTARVARIPIKLRGWGDA